MKNKLIRNTILTISLSSLLAVPTYAQNIRAVPILAQDIDVVHWSETYLEQLSKKFEVDEIFKGKNLNDSISVGDFKKVIKLTIDKDYENTRESMSRETIVYELTKIWAEKTGKDLDKIPIIKMLIYSDTSDIDIRYQNGIYVAYMYNIAKGKEGRIFDPKTNVTYGELAVLINNTSKAIEKELNLDAQPIAEGRYETKGNYELKDDKVIFNFELMSHYTEAQELMFGSGQQFELTITDEDGEEVYRFSDGKFFTMALVSKTLNPGEVIKWQDEWDMTNKDGEKLTTGNYKAQINVMVITGEDEEIEEEQLTTVMNFTLGSDYELNEEGIIKSEVAKEVIEKTEDDLINAIKDKDAEEIADYVHPVKGVRFTPYTTVSTDNDLVISKEDMVNFFADESSYIWGYYDGSGEEIKLTPSQYYEKFIYTEDFINEAEIGYNEVLSKGNMVENQFDVYENAIVVEYHIPEINPEFEGLDWQSLRLVFEEHEGNWKLVGIIHNQWTI